MKKTLYIFISILFTITINAQAKKKSEFGIFSAGVGLGLFQSSKNTLKKDYSGLNFIADYTFFYKEHLMSASYVYGTTVQILGAASSYNEITIQYGQSFEASKIFSIECFAGVGKFEQTSKSDQIQTGGSISTPIKLNLSFRIADGLSFDISNIYSINKINNIFSGNFAIKFKP